MGTARNAGLVLFSAIFLGDEITATQAVGYAICLFFFGLYNYYKMHKITVRARLRRARTVLSSSSCAAEESTSTHGS
eukprot:scaffold39568_cov69-Phaeocystis_antarctica.AAC.1